MDINQPSLEDDIKNDRNIIQYLSDYEIAVDFYNALCNTTWEKIQDQPEDERIISRLRGDKKHVWSCSWRYAGGIISDIRYKHYNLNEDYLSFYCAGGEGNVTQLVESCFNKLGWFKCE